MQLWLADFQRIGAIFIPLGMDHKAKKPTLVGQLIFVGQEKFLIEVRTRKGAQPMIVKVISDADDTEGFSDRKTLLAKRTAAINQNKNNVCQMIKNRRLNIATWTVLVVAFFILICRSGIHLVQDFNHNILVLFLIALGAFFFLCGKRFYMIRNGFFNMEVRQLGKN